MRRRLILIVSLALLLSILGIVGPAKADPWTLTLTTPTPEIKTNYTATITATANQAPSGQQLQIFNADTGDRVAGCFTASCQYVVGYSTIPQHFIAYVGDFSWTAPPGNIQATSSQLTITPAPWTVELATDKTFLKTSETATLTATANQSATGSRVIQIYDAETGARLASCSNFTTCQAYVGVGVDPRSFIAYVAPSSSTAPPSGWVGKSNLTYVAREPWSVTLEPINSGANLLATVNQSVYSGPYKTQIYDTTANTRVADCSTGTSCQTIYALTSGHEYVAYVGTDSSTPPPPIYAAGSAGWGTVEGLDIEALSKAFAAFPLSRLCEEFVFAPGSHVTSDTVTDQTLMCEAAVTAGKTLPQFLADLAAAGLGVASVWYVLHRLTGADGNVVAPDQASDPGAPRPIPPPHILAPIWGSDDLADDLLEQNPEATQDQVDVAATVCLWYVTAAGPDEDFPMSPEDECKGRPIFLTGEDARQAADHDVDALLLTNPLWVRLNYQPAGSKPAPGTGWKTTPCGALPAPPGETSVACDEYPFFATYQGGGYATPTPSLRKINFGQNSLQGTRYSQFLSAGSGCGLSDGDPFLGTPIPQGPADNLDTFWLCP